MLGVWEALALPPRMPLLAHLRHGGWDDAERETQLAWKPVQLEFQLQLERRHLRRVLVEEGAR